MGDQSQKGCLWTIGVVGLVLLGLYTLINYSWAVGFLAGLAVAIYLLAERTLTTNLISKLKLTFLGGHEVEKFAAIAFFVCLLLIGGLGQAIKGGNQQSQNDPTEFEQDKSEIETSVEPQEEESEPKEDDEKSSEVTLPSKIGDLTDGVARTYLSYKYPDERPEVTFDQPNGKIDIVIKKEMAWDENDMVFQSVDMSNELFEAFFQVEGLNQVGVEVQAEFTDQYGKKSWDRAVYLCLVREEAQKVQWDNFKDTARGVNIISIAKDVYIHGAIRENLTNEDIIQRLAAREL